MGAIFKAIGMIFQVIIAIPKISEYIEKIMILINAELEKRRKKKRDQEIKKALEDALKNKDASSLENLLNRGNVNTSSSKKL